MKATLPSIAVVVVLALALGTLPMGAQPSCPSLTPIVLGNQTNLAFIDVNRNGQLDSGDCVVTGVGNQTSNSGGLAQGVMCFTALQGGTPLIAGCNAAYNGSAYLDAGSGSGMASDSAAGVDITYGHMTNSSASSAQSGAAAGEAGFPVGITAAAVFDIGGSVGDGSLCSDGGPAIMATVRGVNGVARFEKKSVGGVPYLCSDLPFPTMSGVEMLPLCISSGSGDSILGGLQNGPTFVEFPLTELPGCGGRGAPSANEWGLLGLAVGLLAFGTWTLRRFPGFGGGLPRV